VEILPRNVLLASWLNAIRGGTAGFDDLYRLIGTEDLFGNQPLHEAISQFNSVVDKAIDPAPDSNGGATAFYLNNQELLQIGAHSWIMESSKTWAPSNVRAPALHTYSFKECRRLIDAAIAHSLTLIESLESASDRGLAYRAEVRERISRATSAARTFLPPTSILEVELLDKSLSLLIISQTALLDQGGAVTAEEIDLRARELTQLRRSARDSLILAAGAWSAPRIL
jgi:hypothetical protein